MIPYHIDFNELSKKIRELGFSKVLLQVPEGMQIYAQEIADALKNFDVYISANPCYGACDIEIYQDILTIQFGHSKIPNIKYPNNIIFVEAFSTISFRNVLNNFIKTTNCKNVGILATIQHIKAIPSVKKYLISHGFKAFVGRGDSRITYTGQVLGCNFSAARDIKNFVDCFILLGTGVFHGMGVRLVTKKEVFVLDPYSNKVTKVDADSFLRQRYSAIAKAEEAQKFGILMSSKIGQKRWNLASIIAEKIKQAGKSSHFIVTNNIVPENIYYDVDAYINTACPRVTYDDYLRFNKVVLSPIEALIALGERDWSDLTFDEIVEVD